MLQVYWIQKHIFVGVWHSKRVGILLYVIFAEILFWAVVSGILHRLKIYWKLQFWHSCAFVLLYSLPLCLLHTVENDRQSCVQGFYFGKLCNVNKFVHFLCYVGLQLKCVPYFIHTFVQLSTKLYFVPHVLMELKRVSQFIRVFCII